MTNQYVIFFVITLRYRKFLDVWTYCQTLCLSLYLHALSGFRFEVYFMKERGRVSELYKRGAKTYFHNIFKRAKSPHIRK